MKTLNFGIEMEMTGLTRRVAATVIKSVVGGTFTYIGGTYDTWSCIASDGREWKAMKDSSISAEKKDSDGDRVMANDSYKTEIVSPICKCSDIETVQAIVRALKEKGALINRSCGIHIHVGAEKFTPKSMCVLVNMMGKHQDLFTKAVKTQQRRLEWYCRKLKQSLLEKFKEEKPDTFNKLLRIWYEGADPDGYAQKLHYNDTRYHVLNLHAFNTKNTVEYRLYESSLHAGKIKAYIQMSLALTAKALKTNRITDKEVDMTNPAYACRMWLRQLGLNGDEFSTCRYHMLHNLEGNLRGKNGASANRSNNPFRHTA